MHTISVPPRSLDLALDHVRKGGRLCVRTCTRVIPIDQKTLVRFERVGAWLLKESGDGYRLRQGNSSVFVLPGQLEAIEENGVEFSCPASTA